MINQEFAYNLIGKALISVQRVEFVAEKLVEYLIENDEKFYGLTTEEFKNNVPAIDKLNRTTLGNLFRLLKHNPELAVNSDFDNYRARRNILAHNFWKEHLIERKGIEVEKFCQDICQDSLKFESFFKGFIYFLALRFVENESFLPEELKIWKGDLDFFMKAIKHKRILKN
jgi:hypothetical protein